LTIHVAARLVRIGPKGRARWKSARVGLATSTAARAANWAAAGLAAFGSLIRSKEYFTSSAVNFSPLWNVTLSSRSKTQVHGSGDVHDFARTP
jgi:2-methylcitrate dehydratase PrpD